MKSEKISDKQPESLGNSLFRLLDTRKISAADLARALNLPYNTINRLLNGITHTSSSLSSSLSPSSPLLLLFPPFANCVMYHNPGIVVRIGREKLSVLLQGGAVQQVLPSDLHYGNQNMQSKRAVTLDSRKQAVSETDAGAATKRISKSFLFFFLGTVTSLFSNCF